MANVIEIQSLQEPGVEVFGTLTEAQLRHRIDAERGIFIAESPKVIRVYRGIDPAGAYHRLRYSVRRGPDRNRDPGAVRHARTEFSDGAADDDYFHRYGKKF